MTKRVLITVLALLFAFSETVSAAVLGDVADSGSVDMGAYTYFYNTVYNSADGPQAEYYAEYTPNAEAVPVVVNGETVWGRRDINEAVSYMRQNNMRPLLGVNADYFSFQTGIPMGHTIIDGEIASKESEGQDAVGFRADGSGFIGWLDIETRVSDGNKDIEITFINKWCQAGFDAVYLITDKFGDTTKTASECVFVVCTPEKGKLGIGKELTLTVDENRVYNGEAEVPDGKMVLLADVSTNAEQLDFLKSLQAGQKITITNTALGDERWNEVENGLSTVGGRLLNNGEIGSGFEPGAAPRTAVGIKPDGNIIFYVLDGRQPSYSVGARLVTLAERMKELGCTDALNLDGGGSTTIAGVFPGSDISAVINSPSEGVPRQTANFIFLRDNRKPTGVPMIINALPAENTKYLAGMKTDIQINSVYDTHNYRMEKYGRVKYTAENEGNGASVTDKNGTVTFAGQGGVKITASIGDARADMYFESYETPDEIRIYNSTDSREIAEIYTEADEELQLDLTASAFVGGEKIEASDELFKWETEGGIGEITEDGIFTLANGVNKSGKIKVTAGDLTKEISVVISDYPKPVNPFADTVGHWAEDVISLMAADGVIRGSEENGQTVFRPDGDMTRAEFASMLANFMNIDISENDAYSAFADSGDIPEWAHGSVGAMSEAGIILGRQNDDGTLSFAPSDKITRAETMTILSRIISSDSAAPIAFADSADIPEWAESGTAILVNAGIVTGYEDNTIRPNENVKRAEAVVMLSKLE